MYIQKKTKLKKKIIKNFHRGVGNGNSAWSRLRYDDEFNIF